MLDWLNMATSRVMALPSPSIRLPDTRTRCLAPQGGQL